MNCVTNLIFLTKIHLLMPSSGIKEYNGVKITFYILSNIGSRSYSVMKANFSFPLANMGKVWRKKGEHFSPQCTKKVVKHPGSLMVWGCMSYKGLGNLIFIERKVNIKRF